MPELPEVETIRRQLNSALRGKTITDVAIRFAGNLNIPAHKFLSAVAGKKFRAVERRAKLLIFKLNGGVNLLAHLKMTGRFLIVKKGVAPNKHTHVQFILSGLNDLFWEDYRKFGFIHLLDDAALVRALAKEKYGPEPLVRTFTLALLKVCLRRRGAKKIKPLLMEQSCIAGIGNIYADEILYASRVHPARSANKITDEEFKRMFTATKNILTLAIKRRGSSADAYVDAQGKEGEYVPYLKVYGREGKKCSRCGSAIKKIKLSGRGTHFCPQCQI